MNENELKKLEDRLWAAADKMRGAVSVSDNEFIVLGLIFLKYIYDSFEERYNELMAFYTSIMKEYDDKAELKFKKALEERLNKVQNANHKRFFYDPMFSGEI